MSRLLLFAQLRIFPQFTKHFHKKMFPSQESIKFLYIILVLSAPSAFSPLKTVNLLQK